MSTDSSTVTWFSSSSAPTELQTPNQGTCRECHRHEICSIPTYTDTHKMYFLKDYNTLPSLLWHCWLGVRKSIRPVKTEWCWHGYLSGVSGVRYKQLAYGAADAAATASLLASLKSRWFKPFCYRLTQVVLKQAIKRVRHKTRRVNILCHTCRLTQSESTYCFQWLFSLSEWVWVSFLPLLVPEEKLANDTHVLIINGDTYKQ